MAIRVFVAGATGAIGKPLVVELVKRRYQVFGTSRSRERAQGVERAGARPVLVDAYDREGLARAVAAARPDVVIHQLTDLSGGFAPDAVKETLAKNARLRVEGTRNLMDAVLGASVKRVVAQSICWIYASGREPHVEADPYDLAAADAQRAETVRGVKSLEDAVLTSPPVTGLVLRYGWLYGPGASDNAAGEPSVHVDDAALAAALAVERGAPGIYNVAEPGPHIDVSKAQRELGWTATKRKR
jgi:nucleoside-diphosphate-sugar epimerase